MKITKKQLKKLIVEELSADAELLKTMNKLAGSIDSLDVSIDYLTSTIKSVLNPAINLFFFFPIARLIRSD